MKKPAKTDIAVLMLFFNREEPLKKVFEQVQKARPSRLFLYQDGPRNEQDIDKILACRKVVESIDWECQVERHYCEHNQGCDPSGYLAQKWAFSMAEKVIVLEDDVVPAESFFPFCKEMLDRYEDDPRIGMVAGFNVDEQTPEVDSDYFFTSAFSIWGWASWRRVVEQWDSTYRFLEEEQTVKQLEHLIQKKELRSDFLTMCQDHKRSGKPFFESIFWSTLLLNQMMAIMPTKNLINNVGAMADSTHFSTELATMPHKLRIIFTMKRFELSFPLKHPAHIMEYTPYKERLYKINAWGHPWIKCLYSLEELWLNLKRGDGRKIVQAITRRIRKWMGTENHR